MIKMLRHHHVERPFRQRCDPLSGKTSGVPATCVLPDFPLSQSSLEQQCFLLLTLLVNSLKDANNGLWSKARMAQMPKRNRAAPHSHAKFGSFSPSLCQCHAQVLNYRQGLWIRCIPKPESHLFIVICYCCQSYLWLSKTSKKFLLFLWGAVHNNV